MNFEKVIEKKLCNAFGEAGRKVFALKRSLKYKKLLDLCQLATLFPPFHVSRSVDLLLLRNSKVEMRNNLSNLVSRLSDCCENCSAHISS